MKILILKNNFQKNCWHLFIFYIMFIINPIMKKSKKFRYGFLPAIVGVATCGLIFQLSFLLPAIATDSTRIILKTSCIGFYVMCFISFYQTISITNSLPPTLQAPRKKLQLYGNHYMYFETKKCEKQSLKHKPQRTSHCKSCECVSRMDHHCPYTDCCIGSKNLKAFLLFCGYGGTFALQYFVLSIVFFLKIRWGEIQPIGEMELFAFMFLILMSFLLSFNMNGLFISNLILACKNFTQLDIIKGSFKFIDSKGIYPNPYNLGVFSNYNSIFDGDYWLFWWPSEILTSNDGTQFPLIPPVTQQQMKSLPEQAQFRLKDVISRSIPQTIEELRKQELSRYEGVKIFFKNEEYQIKNNEEKQQKETLDNIQQIN